MSPPRGDDVILCINTGSSSLKFAIFTGGAALLPDASGAVEGIGQRNGRSWIRRADGRRELPGAHPDHAAALDAAMRLLAELGAPSPTIVGHRVVHGGARYCAPVRVDDAVVAGLQTLVAIAPLHLPPAIAAIEAMTRKHPHIPQVACFDTAFHASMPEVAKRLPIPVRFDEAGVRRYGFHGLSYEYVMSVLGARAPRRIVIAHLGNGSSLVAVRDGTAIDTTMGFTPSGGIMMGTRTGDIDPGVLLYLLRAGGLSVVELEQIVERESGLHAIGGTSDMKTLVERAPADSAARLAVSMFGYAVRKAIGGLVAALGGVDLLVFTGGIGEHAPVVRAAACDGLDSIGIRLDPRRNERREDPISASSSTCIVRVIPTDEDVVIARHAIATVGATSSSPP